MANILVVDDDPHVLESVADLLQDEGHSVTAASSGQQALDMIMCQKPDLVILDVIMPEMDGIEVCRRIRADPYVAKLPILFLTAKARSSDIVNGLEAGGDDYLVKPFDARELPARVNALLRRAARGPLDPQSDDLIVRDLRLHTTRPEVQVGDCLVELTSLEHRLLYYLMQRAGQVIPIEQMLQDVWEYPPGTGDPALVYVHINALRDKLTDETHEYIRNVRGRGYVMDA